MMERADSLNVDVYQTHKAITHYCEYEDRNRKPPIPSKGFRIQFFMIISSYRILFTRVHRYSLE